MNIPTISHSQTMTSREIAELTGKRHDNVMRDIRDIIRQLTEAGEDVSGFVENTCKNERGKSLLIFEATYSATMTLISGYNVVIRSKIINRWQALESQTALPADYPSALRALADKVEHNKKLALENEDQRHSLKNKDSLILASNKASIKSGEILVREFAKSIDFIKVGQNKMYKWLRDCGFIMESKEPYQKFVTMGWFTWKPSEEKINGEYRYTLHITPRGKLKLTERYWNHIENDVTDKQGVAA